MKETCTASYADLLARIAANDQKAFGQLYDIFYPELTRHVLNKIKSQETAEDILHDLFLSLWKNRANILTIESIPAYLYSAVRYLIIAEYRKSKLRELHSGDIQDLDIIQEEVSLEDRLYYRYILDELQKEIENLPEKCKQVFKLSREHFMSIKEIAAEMDISESTVKKHIHKAISHLRVVSGKRFGFILFF